MLRTFASLALAALAATAVVACGDGPDNAATDTAQPSAATTTAADGSATATPASGSATPDWPGPAPDFGTNIKAVTPEHGQSVTQLDTQSPDPTRPRGVCFEADFEGLPTNEGLLWYRFAYDGEDITAELTWLVASQQDPEGGRACYAPAEGLAPGRHDAAVAVQNPNNPNEPTREIVGWKFEVTEE